MEYKIIHATTASALEVKVSRYLKDGWKPQGGVVFTIGKLDSWLLQAMVKED
jgi:hypothetical protein